MSRKTKNRPDFTFEQAMEETKDWYRRSPHWAECEVHHKFYAANYGCPLCKKLEAVNGLYCDA